MAPEVFAAMRASRDRGARRSRSKDRPFLSKVTVTAKTEVVPKSMAREIIPGISP